MTKSEVRRKCERLAKAAGAKLTWIKGGPDYGYYIPGTNQIFVGGSTKKHIITIFCHEIAHYKNFLKGKYYKYHHLTGKQFLRRFKTKHAAVIYSLKAEIYTDQVGKRLCAQYFPDVVYKGSYKMNQQFYNMMYDKYFGGFIIILIDDKQNATFILQNNLTNALIYDRI
jgi:hypothetical protein